jgi:hypothetical protein
MRSREKPTFSLADAAVLVAIVVLAFVVRGC